MTRLAASFLAIVAAACSSPTPATSSSSHWVTCTTMAECTSVAAAVACTGGYCVDSQGQKVESGGTPTPGPCDPLTPHELPVTLGTVLGVGRDAQGTTYMADHVPTKSIDRVFVSEGNSLFRKRVIGSGSSGGPPDADYTFTFEEGFDAATARALLIQQRGGVVTAMALGPASDKRFIPDGGPTGGALTVLDTGALSAFTLRNLPGGVTIQYVADVTDGHIIVVTAPTDDSDYTDLRLFYGNSESAMVEEHVVNVVRSRSGGTDIQFEVNGATYTARFDWIMDITDAGTVTGHPGQATLDTGTESLAVNQRYPTPMTLGGFAFTCQ